MAGDRKIGRNEDFCKKYASEGREKKNKALKHKRLATRLESKRARMVRRGMDIEGISKQIQHHKSLSP